ncbi:hypothetical protein Tco_1159004 [Tanacetum coccineum]
MYIKSYSFSLFSSLPGVLTPVRGESLKILNGFDVSLPVSHSLWSSQSFGHQKAINGFDMPLPVAVCSGLVNPLAPRKVHSTSTKCYPSYLHPRLLTLQTSLLPNTSLLFHHFQHFIAILIWFSSEALDFEVCEIPALLVFSEVPACGLA